ncbi:TonB-dependent receptor [Novosphingobium sp. M1R2S20]|uniref:TonB-dependent receptor n=1 Tax=Novosphingobium rhizovicinum TaxID=3228928 RepID=A0ABV3R792_9SPHN
MRHTAAKLFLFATTALGSFAPAMAQDGGDIVVTARRTEERLQDVPISITVFNQEQVSNRNIVSGADLATYTPSLAANSRYGAETATFAIRGFTQESFTSPSVAIYFADVIGPRAQGGTPGGNGAGVGQFFDLQNVQVLKGPQGTLFGRNTTGGAVLIVPQRPKDELGGYIEGSYGNYDMKRVQGALNVPLADTFKVRLGFDRMKRDGFLKNQASVGPDAFGDVDYTALRLSILAELTPDLENYIIARYSKSDTNGTAGKLVGANAAGCDAGVDRSRFGLPSPTSTAYYLAPLACAQLQRSEARGDGYFDVEVNNPNPFLKIEQWGVQNTTTWNVSDTITLKNIASYQEFRQRQSFNIGSDNYSVPAPGTDPRWFNTPASQVGLPFTWVGLAPDPNYDNVNQATWTEEFQIQGRTTDGSLNYVLGGYYEGSAPGSQFQGSLSPITTVLQPSQTGAPIPIFTTVSCANLQALDCTAINNVGNPLIPSIIQNSLTRYWYQNVGFFAQGTYALTDQLSLTGGIRYTIDKVKGQGATRTIRIINGAPPIIGCAASGTGPDCLTTIKQKSEKPTWLISLDYKPTNDVLLYAKYARGYRQGNVNASNTIPVAWGPEKVDTYEIGAKTSFRGTLSGYFNIAAFYNDFSNQQLAANLIPNGTVPNASPSQAIVNAGKSKIQGVEADASISYEGANLNVGYAYLDTELKSYNPPAFEGYFEPTTGALIGGDLPLSPKHRLTVTPSYTLPLDYSIGRVSISATYTYTAKQVATNDSPYGVLPSSDLWNLNLNWNSVGGSPVDLAAFVTNLTNEKYPVFVGNSWLSTGSENLILGQPRMYGARLRVTFGGG